MDFHRAHRGRMTMARRESKGKTFSEVLGRNAMAKDRFLTVTERGTHGNWSYDDLTRWYVIVYSMPFGYVKMFFVSPEVKWEGFREARMSVAAKRALTTGDSSITKARKLANVGSWVFYLETGDEVEEEPEYGWEKRIDEEARSRCLEFGDGFPGE